MNDYKVGYMTITDGDSSVNRFSIPNYIVDKLDVNPTMRLDMLGFQFYTEPFSFSFTDLRDSTNVYLHTNQSTFVFMDKFIQMDL